MPESLLEHRDLLGRLNSMRERDFQIILMRAQGATYVQIARAQGVSIETARHVLLRHGLRFGFRFDERHLFAALIGLAFLGSRR